MSQYVKHRLLQGTLIRGSHSFLSQCQWWGICLRMAFEAWPLLEEIQYSISEKNILLPAFLFFKKIKLEIKNCPQQKLSPPLH